jgi:hypothetical protein
VQIVEALTMQLGIVLIVGSLQNVLIVVVWNIPQVIVHTVGSLQNAQIVEV